MNNTKMKIIYTKAPQTIKMSNKCIANLFLIDVLIGTRKIPFVFDTGASLTVISKSISESVGAVALDGLIAGGGNANIRISGSKRFIDSMQIGEAKIYNLPVAVLPDESLDFGLDEDGNEIKVNGFLGWDIIQHFKWTIDCLNGLFIIEQPIESEDKGALFWDNMPIIIAKYSGQPMYFGFDTGNTESMFSQHFIPYLETKQEKIDTLTGVDGVVEENVLVANHTELAVGKKVIELNDSSVLKRDIFPTQKYKVMGLLGADIIQNKRCVIDYLNHSFEIM